MLHSMVLCYVNEVSYLAGPRPVVFINCLIWFILSDPNTDGDCGRGGGSGVGAGREGWRGEGEGEGDDDGGDVVPVVSLVAEPLGGGPLDEEPAGRVGRLAPAQGTLHDLAALRGRDEIPDPVGAEDDKTAYGRKWRVEEKKRKKKTLGGVCRKNKYKAC